MQIAVMRSERCEMRATYLTILAVLLSVLFYENSVGKFEIPRSGRRTRSAEREVGRVLLA
jgi:hypothetical protein